MLSIQVPNVGANDCRHRLSDDMFEGMITDYQFLLCRDILLPPYDEFADRMERYTFESGDYGGVGMLS